VGSDRLAALIEFSKKSPLHKEAALLVQAERNVDYQAIQENDIFKRFTLEALSFRPRISDFYKTLKGRLSLYDTIKEVENPENITFPDSRQSDYNLDDLKGQARLVENGKVGSDRLAALIEFSKKSPLHKEAALLVQAERAVDYQAIQENDIFKQFTLEALSFWPRISDLYKTSEGRLRLYDIIKKVENVVTETQLNLASQLFQKDKINQFIVFAEQGDSYKQAAIDTIARKSTTKSWLSTSMLLTEIAKKSQFGKNLSLETLQKLMRKREAADYYGRPTNLASQTTIFKTIDQIKAIIPEDQLQLAFDMLKEKSFYAFLDFAELSPSNKNAALQALQPCNIETLKTIAEKSKKHKLLVLESLNQKQGLAPQTYNGLFSGLFRSSLNVSGREKIDEDIKIILAIVPDDASDYHMGNLTEKFLPENPYAEESSDND